MRKPNKIKTAAYLTITFGWMWFIATFRYGIGFDYYSYIEIFEQIRGAQNLSALWDFRYEPGFALLTWIMTFFIGDANITANATAMYGVYQVFILLPVVWFVYKYCKDAWLSTWLYATLTFFYISMNFTRQALAASVSLLGYRFLCEKKPIHYFAVVLLAASFHVSALIMVPIYFLCHIRLSKKLAIFYGSAVVFVYFTSELILDFVTRFVFTSYIGTTYLEWGFSFRYMFVPTLIFAACLVLLKLWERRDPDAMMLTNMMMFSFVIWLFSTRHLILERFSMYPSILLMVAVPAMVSALRPSEESLSEFSALSSASSKEAVSKRTKLAKTIKEGREFYWSAVAAVIIVTFIYHSLGINMGEYGFHNVFPYMSVFEWLGEVIPRTNIILPDIY